MSARMKGAASAEPFEATADLGIGLHVLGVAKRCAMAARWAWLTMAARWFNGSLMIVMMIVLLIIA